MRHRALDVVLCKSKVEHLVVAYSVFFDSLVRLKALVPKFHILYSIFQFIQKSVV